MAVEIRNYLDGFDDREAALRKMSEVDETAFGEGFSDEDISSPIFGVMDDDRTFLAWESDQVVGVSANFSLDISVPGGSVPTAGVTFIGVRPTHRRRGVMTAMLDNLHADGLRRAEPMAALWAADPAIYPRFGYGRASRLMRTVIKRAHGTLSDAPEDTTLRLRMLNSSDDFDLTQPIYAEVRAGRGGVPAVDERWHARQTWDPLSRREGASALYTVVAEDDNGVRGFMRYNLKPEWTAAHDDGTFQIYRMMSRDPAAHAALWRYALSFDLMSKVSWFNAPIDDPIQLWLTHPRHATRQPEDALYVRLLDLPSAMTAQTYSAECDVVVDVTDNRFPENAGRWRITTGQGAASCVRTTDAAGLALDIRVLGAAYLGDASLRGYARAGWIEELRPGTLPALDAAMHWDVPPYCPFIF
jgi:predicted acetyltransferase